MKFSAKFIVKPSENFYGLSYGEWSSIWWNWLFSGQTQSRSVYFLRGNTENESRIIRRGKDGPSIYSDTAIFFPIICTITSEHLDRYATTQEIRRRESSLRQKYPLELCVLINGVAIGNLRNYYIESPEFMLDIPKDSKLRTSFDPVFGAGTFPAVSAGYWLMLRPLPPGNYNIIFKGVHADGFISYGDYTVRILDSSRR